MAQDEDNKSKNSDEEASSEYKFESDNEEVVKDKSNESAKKSETFIMESPEEKVANKRAEIAEGTEKDQKKEPSSILQANEEIMSAPLVKKRSILAVFLDLVLNLAIIIGLVLIIRTFIISPFQVYGPSMCDTFNNFFNKCGNSFGEYLIVNKFGYQNFFGYQVGLPDRGDIVIFHPPHDDSEFFIKRVIGLPGETLKIQDGKVYIHNEEHPNGVELNEPYLNSENRDQTKTRINDLNVFEIPEDGYFVMGDNRAHSSDSRSCFSENQNDHACETENHSSYLTLDHIEGKAWIILWPFGNMSFIPDTEYSI